MADELDPVEQQFIADMDEYLADLEVGATEAKAFADANTEAATAVDDLRDNAAEADAEIVQLVVATNDAADATGQLRDDATEADGALDTLAASAEAAAEAEGSLRDNAAEADAALGDQRDDAAEAAAATDLLAVSLGDAHDSSGKLLDDSKDLKDGLDDVKNGADDSKNSIEDLARDGSAAGSLLSSVFGAGGAVSSGFGQLSGLVEKVPTSLIAIVPAVEALLPEVVGLGAGFAAAGAGAGAFALLAAPAFKTVSTAYTQISADQKAYDDALTATAKNTALKKLQQDYKDLDPAELGAVKGIQSLMDTYQKMAKAFEPDAFKVFNDGLKLANTLLPDIVPFANTFATTLDKLLQQADKFAASNGFKDWLAQFQKLEGPSLTAIGDGIGKVVVAIGKLMTVMSAKDVVNAINIAFTVLAGTINVVTSALQRIMTNWDQMSAAASTAAHALSSDADSMREAIVSAGQGIESAWNSMVSFVKSATSGLASDISSTWNGITSFITSAMSGIASDVSSTWNDIKSTTASVWDDIKSAITSAASGIVSDAESAWNTVRSDTTAAWNDVKSAVETGVSNVVSYVSGLPGKMLSALGNTGSLLVNAGEQIIDGLINGIESALGGLESVLSNISSLIPSWKGPPAADLLLLHNNGQLIMQGLMNGIGSQMPALREQLGGVSDAIPGALGGFVGGAVANGSSVHVNVPITLGAGTQGYNNPAFLQYIQQTVQEATLRYTQVNPSNGLNLAGKLA